MQLHQPSIKSIPRRRILGAGALVWTAVSWRGSLANAPAADGRRFLLHADVRYGLPAKEAIPLPQETAVSAMQRARQWVAVCLKLVVKYQQNPLRASRTLAYLQVAMHEAWVLAVQAEPLAREHLAKAQELAVARAAYGVLEHFYPNESPGFFAVIFAVMEAEIYGARQASQQHDQYATWAALALSSGAAVAELAIARSLLDGAGRVWPLANRPKAFAGIWEPAYPLYAVNPLEAFAGNWRPWVSPSGSRYSPPTAPRPGSEQYEQEVLEVLRVFRQISPAQREAALRWNLEAGSVTPAGIWTKLAWDALMQEVSQQQAHSMAGVGRFLQVASTVSIAMHDAFIACWGVKYRDWSERPITAIRRKLDPAFVPILVTPSFPAYVSGHATVSASAATVLAHLLPDQAARLQSLAQEAAMSRLWGGIHFHSDNTQGLRLGQSVAQDVLAFTALAALR
jgi:hypothetical protein